MALEGYSTGMEVPSTDRLRAIFRIFFIPTKREEHPSSRLLRRYDERLIIVSLGKLVASRLKHIPAPHYSP
jgi:hypothetical protein